MMLLAQLAGYSLIQILIFLIVIIGIVAVVFVITKAMGVAIPGWVVQVGWILVAVVVGVLAIKFLASML